MSFQIISSCAQRLLASKVLAEQIVLMSMLTGLCAQRLLASKVLAAEYEIQGSTDGISAQRLLASKVWAGFNNEDRLHLF